MFGTTLRHDRDPFLSEVGTLLEIADQIGLSDEALYLLRKKHPIDFPAPVRRVGNATLYYEWEVEAFHREHTNRKAFK